MSKDPQAVYYDVGGIEVYEIIKAKLTSEQFKGYLLGNIIKYSTRLNHKDNQPRDAQKCAFYSKQLDEMVNSECSLKPV